MTRVCACDGDGVKRSEKREKLNKALEKVRVELKELNIHARENEKDRQYRETLSTLTQLFRGVYGRLVDLVKPRQKRYETAAAVALGTNYNAVVVEDKDVAMECMHYLKQERKGHMTFIPLSTVKSEELHRSMRSLGHDVHAVTCVVGKK